MSRTTCHCGGALERLLLAVWIGSLCAVGLIVAPVLFHLLDRTLAGTVAGHLFAITAWLGLCCGFLLLGLQWLRLREPVWQTWCLLLMLVLVAAGHFLLAPMIAGLRAAGLVESARFGLVHGLASVLYLITLVTGLVLVAAGPPAGSQSSAAR